MAVPPLSGSAICPEEANSSASFLQSVFPDLFLGLGVRGGGWSSMSSSKNRTSRGPSEVQCVL